MKQSTVAWDNANLTQLKMFASQLLSIGFQDNIGEDTLRAKIRQAFDGDEITFMVPDDMVVAERQPDAPNVAAADTPHDSKALRGSSGALDPMVTVTISCSCGSPVEVSGRSTAMPVCIIGAVIIKTISRTRTTSSFAVSLFPTHARRDP